MQLLSLFIFALLSVTSPISAEQDASHFKIDFRIRRGDSRKDISESAPRIVKRADPDGAVNMVILNQQTFYLANLSIGSNKDSVGVLVDTGSSDLWVMSHDLKCSANPNSKREAKNKIDHFGSGTGVVNIFKEQSEKRDDDKPPPTKSSNENNKAFAFTTITLSPDGFQTPSIGGGSGGAGSGASACTALGSFNTGKSDTFVKNNTSPFQIEYADGSDATGIWGFDNVFIGDTKVANLSFAVANETSSDVGVLGIGLSGLETTTQFGYVYENLPLKMRNQGLINRALFSIYLGQANDNKGSILFGAIDHAKFLGNLVTLPMQRTYQQVSVPVRIQIGLDSVNLQGVSGSSSSSLLSDSTGVVLDTGSTLSYVSADVLQALGEALGGTYNRRSHAYIVNCNQPKGATLNLGFSNQTIKVPVSDLLIQATSSQCYLGVLAQSTATSYMLFGDNILRHAYVVMDLDGFEVSLAPVNFTNDEDIEVISSTVPTTGATTTPSSSGRGSTGGNSGSSGSSGGSGSSSSGDSETTSSTGKQSAAHSITVRPLYVIGLTLLISLSIMI
ncbi:uncharacterized protein SPAPADRAFT_141168 [Spathaspora passalidarum NRRL Y-27907]|uniref:candidapepsin n=1 Tax=Spathaspora passalidarum (strain NRRL Y-27907 / 11-Y1) TaxID=619300 RepID=G3ART5_SPAPN|nr:uncharacterized protein SPAPADRAFT_141168 [Spathaspora passalidarum NRRL Y-27907]EGW31352.1 hypothetical protein SPAPADRAFT_141168 [Spathaspora passalidarum NRRL Y-27907]